jgi:hypothetical protein
MAADSLADVARCGAVRPDVDGGHNGLPARFVPAMQFLASFCMVGAELLFGTLFVWHFHGDFGKVAGLWHVFWNEDHICLSSVSSVDFVAMACILGAMGSCDGTAAAETQQSPSLAHAWTSTQAAA